MNEIDAVYHEAALKFGLSDSALLVLYTVCHNGEECLLNDITSTSGISKQTMNSALRKLETDGIIYLTSTGGRKKTVSLTDKGKAFVENTVIKVISIENDIFGLWTEEEHNSHIELTQKYPISMKGLDHFMNHYTTNKRYCPHEFTTKLHSAQL